MVFGANVGIDGLYCILLQNTVVFVIEYGSI
jgi:hypothetical protein